MQPAKHFKENAPSPVEPCVTTRVTVDICHLCDQPITAGRTTQVRKEGQPDDSHNRVHAICEHEYAIAMLAFRRASRT